jgi:ornithine cyclodeaminase/alanine dehydrogenase-like protein (mu-crystallin family)
VALRGRLRYHALPMALHLTEDDVEKALTMDACLEAVEGAFQQWAVGNAANRPRTRAAIPGSILHVLPAASSTLKRLAAKVYATAKGGIRFVVLLFDAGSADLLAVIEADRLGQMRTGAATGVATRCLAGAGAAILGILGTGWQARSQVQAIARVRTLREVRAWGRDRGRLIDFCAEVAKLSGVAVLPAASAEAAVRGADIVVTATSAATPVLKGSWLAPGAHLNAVGSNRPDRRELDDDAIGRSDLIVVDSLDQARLEAGDLLLAAAPGGPPIDRAVELADIVSGRRPGRQGERQITLFKSLGIGLEDLAVASLAYDRAIALGLGRPIA